MLSEEKPEVAARSWSRLNSTNPGVDSAPFSENPEERMRDPDKLLTKQSKRERKAVEFLGKQTENLTEIRCVIDV